MAGRTSSTNTRARVFAFRLRSGRAVRIKFFLYSFLFFSFKRSLFCIFEKTKTSGRRANDGG